MPPLNATLDELVDYLKDKAQRYAAIAQGHIQRSEVYAAGTDQTRPNAVFAAKYQDAARQALQLAQQYADYATWFAMLRPLDQAAPGDQILVPATFLRRAADEDFPGEAFVRVAGASDPLRLPIQPAAVSA
ncbi:hypothetical protein CA606_18065 [Caulobacter vibrioides]|uniref:Uncharacterized protein n=1 Tax=Caulobacter vibrioides TaxID=155892 RepID=A0A290MPZ5_CAUVI|nr:hypothetical protein [Caulobacter vibrioides]ATC34081.1 hypothetical protein CA606_18065 [Caulobacter vibrioides]